MGSDGFPPHLWPGSALYGPYSGLSGEGGHARASRRKWPPPKAQVGQRLLSGLRQRTRKKGP
jgi:hypothetical protein